MKCKWIPIVTAALCFFQSLIVCGQATQKKAITKITLPAIAAIRPSELKADLFDLTDDHFRGREAGTPDELKASVWLAEKIRKIGLVPAGDDGTFFQFFSLQRNRVSPISTVKIGDSTFQLWKDVLIAQTAPAEVNAPVIFINTLDPSQIDTPNIKGKAVAILASPAGLNLNVSLLDRRYPGYVLRKYSSTLINNGAAAIIFIADSLGEKSWPAVIPPLTLGLYDIEGGPNSIATSKPPVLWFHQSAIDLFKQSGLVLKTKIEVEKFEYPSVNVIGIVRGTDPELANEYVIFSSHQDHEGIRTPYGNDSIYNGADDNASSCVAMLAVARAFKAQPAKRSALFIWHGAEERGLLGSKWYSAHPIVPKNSIVAVLNADMIGRNHTDTAGLLGITRPHMNSRDLADLAFEANAEGPKFFVDTTWDNPKHVEGWYFRSDHLPYARQNIPAIFFSSLLQNDYHTPMDEAERINLKKLTRMTQWIYRTGWKVANNIKRPALLPDFKLER
jgi:hypothetical protein